MGAVTDSSLLEIIVQLQSTTFKMCTVLSCFVARASENYDNAVGYQNPPKTIQNIPKLCRKA